MIQRQRNPDDGLSEHLVAEPVKKAWETPTLAVLSVDEAETGPGGNVDGGSFS